MAPVSPSSKATTAWTSRGPSPGPGRTLPPSRAGARRDPGQRGVGAGRAVVVGGAGRIVGYAAANDVSAWDIERENPLFLPQSKVFGGCFAFGPVLATPSGGGGAHRRG